MTYTMKYHVATTGVDFLRSNKDDFPGFLLKKKFNLKIKYWTPKKIKFCPRFSIFKEKIVPQIFVKYHFFWSRENFTTFQHSFLFYGLELWTVSLFLLQMNVLQINVKNLFWDLYSVMRCYARKPGEKTFFYSKEKEGISLTKKYPHMYHLQRNYKNPNTTHNIQVPMLETNYTNPKHPSF